MIGSRNEKALLILCTYVIGFTTAYIAFGVTVSGTEDASMYTANVYSTQSVTRDEVMAEEEVLGVTSQDPVGTTLDTTNPDQVLSPNGSFAYYCEEGMTPGICIPFILDLSTNVANALTIDGEAVTFNTEDATFTWTADNTLTGPGLVSASADAPWELSIQ